MTSPRRRSPTPDTVGLGKDAGTSSRNPPEPRVLPTMCRNLLQMHAAGVAPVSGWDSLRAPHGHLRGHRRGPGANPRPRRSDSLPAFPELQPAVRRRDLLQTREPATDRLLQGARRSEEHTSELQSLRHLVCRLLLEKKNKKI